MRTSKKGRAQALPFLLVDKARLSATSSPSPAPSPPCGSADPALRPHAPALQPPGPPPARAAFFRPVLNFCKFWQDIVIIARITKETKLSAQTWKQKERCSAMRTIRCINPPQPSRHPAATNPSPGLAHTLSGGAGQRRTGRRSARHQKSPPPLHAEYGLPPLRRLHRRLQTAP